MGTRGIYGFRKGGKDKLTYNHYDSVPSGLGLNVAEFVKATPLQELHAIYDRLVMVKEEDQPTPEHIADCVRFTDLSRQSVNDWYCLLHLAQGNLMLTREAYPVKMKAASTFLIVHDGKFIQEEVKPIETLRYMIDYNEFIENSVFCEYGYIINLDTNELEFWKPVYQGEEYSCTLVGRWPLDTLPDDIVTQMEIIDDGHAQNCLSTFECSYR